MCFLNFFCIRYYAHNDVFCLLYFMSLLNKKSDSFFLNTILIISVFIPSLSRFFLLPGSGSTFPKVDRIWPNVRIRLLDKRISIEKQFKRIYKSRNVPGQNWWSLTSFCLYLSMSYLGAAMCIISTAQQARPKVRGHSEPLRPQLTRSSTLKNIIELQTIK